MNPIVSFITITFNADHFENNLQKFNILNPFKMLLIELFTTTDKYHAII